MHIGPNLQTCTCTSVKTEMLKTKHQLNLPYIAVTIQIIISKLLSQLTVQWINKVFLRHDVLLLQQWANFQFSYEHISMNNFYCAILWLWISLTALWSLIGLGMWGENNWWLKFDCTLQHYVLIVFEAMKLLYLAARHIINNILLSQPHYHLPWNANLHGCYL